MTFLSFSNWRKFWVSLFCHNLLDLQCEKLHPCSLKIRYLFNKITFWIKFLTTESRVNKLSVDLKIKLKSLVLFSKNYLTFSVYFFVKHPVETSQFLGRASVFWTFSNDLIKAKTKEFSIETITTLWVIRQAVFPSLYNPLV